MLGGHAGNRSGVGARVRLVAALVVALLALVTVALGRVASARAGTWMQVSCVNPDGSAAGSQGWTSSVQGSLTQARASTDCAPGMPMTAAVLASSRTAAGEGVVLQYAPPAGSTLAGGSVQATLEGDGHAPPSSDGKVHATGYTGLYTPQLVDLANAYLFKECAYWDLPHGCHAYTTDNVPADGDVQTASFAIPLARGGDLYAAARCFGSTAVFCSVPGASGYLARVQISGAHLLLSTPATPGGSRFSGSALQRNARGTAAIVFTATDVGGPGVYSVSASLDGVAVYGQTPNANGGACVSHGTDPGSGALMFDAAQPCPQSETVDVPVPTRHLPDGSHRLTVTVTDAGGATATVYDATIQTRNPQITPRPRRGIRSQFVISWRWRGSSTLLRTIEARKLPRGGRLSVACHPTGRRGHRSRCPRLAVHSVATGHARRLLRALGGRRFHSGDRIVIVVSAPHRRPERIELRIRTGKQPTARLLTHRG